MVDEIFDRQYQAGRQALHQGIDRGLLRFGRSILAGFEVLNAIQWSAPWVRADRAPSKDARCA